MVETKLCRNPEAKREAVAQVLDMALAFSKWEFEQLEEEVKSYTSKSYAKLPRGKLLCRLNTGSVGEA